MACFASSISLIRPKKKQIRTAGENQGTTQVYSWPETERISPLCPQEWQKEFFELDLVGLPLRRGGHGGDLVRGNEAGSAGRMVKLRAFGDGFFEGG
ncbi:MAG: hypothetical protein D3923_07430 [Candidatus Electrothrix sp. AR3]|nr:hypothetical protein [Candidatus Electrothrix sp. AR3]